MPAKNTSFSIGEHFMGFVESEVKEGRYGNASDVMRGPETPGRAGSEAECASRGPARGRAKRPIDCI